MDAPKPIVLILGPTAAGKTDLAVELAGKLPGGGECVCADSMQIYRGMDIGTAKPTPAQRARVPHHVLDLLDPGDDGFSVDSWLQLAQDAIDEIRGRGRHPIVVGGTNLYVQALLYGLFEGPEPDPALRGRLAATDLADLRRRLERVDPDATKWIHPNDRKRTVRALEVFEATGRRISELQTQWGGGRPPRGDVGIIGLDYSTGAINGRINARVKAMIEAGLVEEVQRLGERGGLGRQASEALGYRQIIDHLAGRNTLEQAIEQIKIQTRRLARKQRTWLRRFRIHPASVWIQADGESMQALVQQTLAILMERPSPPRSDPTDPLAAGRIS